MWKKVTNLCCDTVTISKAYVEAWHFRRSWEKVTFSSPPKCRFPKNDFWFFRNFGDILEKKVRWKSNYNTNPSVISIESVVFCNTLLLRLYQSSHSYFWVISSNMSCLPWCLLSFYTSAIGFSLAYINHPDDQLTSHRISSWANTCVSFRWRAWFWKSCSLCCSEKRNVSKGTGSCGILDAFIRN